MIRRNPKAALTDSALERGACSTNLRLAVHNDPINFVDRSGLAGLSINEQAQAVLNYLDPEVALWFKSHGEVRFRNASGWLNFPLWNENAFAEPTGNKGENDKFRYVMELDECSYGSNPFAIAEQIIRNAREPNLSSTWQGDFWNWLEARSPGQVITPENRQASFNEAAALSAQVANMYVEGLASLNVVGDVVLTVGDVVTGNANWGTALGALPFVPPVGKKLASKLPIPKSVIKIGGKSVEIAGDIRQKLTNTLAAVSDKVRGQVRGEINKAKDAADAAKTINRYNDIVQTANKNGQHVNAACKGFPGIKVNAKGAPDFAGSKYMYDKLKKGQRNTEKVALANDYSKDFAQANLQAGFKETPEGYTWHHLDYNAKTGYGTMQLVRKDAHRATYSHIGGAADYAKAHNRPAYGR